MTTFIGQNIKKLRKERGWTQEELASKLNITAQAVCKWENATCSPDISMVVPLTALFGVSADVLFGITPDGMEADIAKVRRIAELPKTTNEQTAKMWLELLERYPYSSVCRYELAGAYMCCASGETWNDYHPVEEQKEYFRLAAEQLEAVLDESTDGELRGFALADLLNCYIRTSDIPNAVRVAKMGGVEGTLSLEMLAKIDGCEDKNYWNQMLIRYYSHGIAWAVLEQTYPDDATAIIAYKAALNVLDSVFVDGNKSGISYVYIYLRERLSRSLAKVGDTDGLHEQLDLWYDEAEFEDNLPYGEHRFKDNPLLNLTSYGHTFSRTHCQRDFLLEHLMSPEFDPFREDSRFRAFVSRAEAMPGVDFDPQ